MIIFENSVLLSELRFRHFIAVGVAAVLVLFTSQIALANDLGPEDYEAFEGHVERSGTLLRNEEFQEGIVELEEARKIIDHPRIAIRLAQAYADWGRCAQSTRIYDEVLQRDDIDDEILEGLAESRDKLTDCTEMASLKVECSPDEATLHILGVERDDETTCPFSEDVAVGDYELRLSAEGYEDKVRQVSVVAEDSQQVMVTLSKSGVAEGIDIVDIEDTESDAGADKGANWTSLAGYGAIGVGTAMLIGGGVMDYRTGGRTEELARARNANDQQRIDELERDASSARTTNIILYAGGLTLITSGLILQFLDFDGPSPATEDRAGLSVGVSPTGISTTFTW